MKASKENERLDGGLFFCLEESKVRLIPETSVSGSTLRKIYALSHAHAYDMRASSPSSSGSPPPPLPWPSSPPTLALSSFCALEVFLVAHLLRKEEKLHMRATYSTNVGRKERLHVESSGHE